MLVTDTDEGPRLLPVLPELTPRQRVIVYLANNLANDLDRGSPIAAAAEPAHPPAQQRGGQVPAAAQRIAEQHTAALLRLAADAIAHGYAGDLVALARGWRLEREREVQP